MQRFPLFVGLLLEGMVRTICPSITSRIRPHPQAQYGHEVVTHWKSIEYSPVSLDALGIRRSCGVYAIKSFFRLYFSLSPLLDALLKALSPELWSIFLIMLID
jgi:hypothetical protein